MDLVTLHHSAKHRGSVFSITHSPWLPTNVISFYRFSRTVFLYLLLYYFLYFITFASLFCRVKTCNNAFIQVCWNVRTATIKESLLLLTAHQKPCRSCWLVVHLLTFVAWCMHRNHHSLVEDTSVRPCQFYCPFNDVPVQKLKDV